MNIDHINKTATLGIIIGKNNEREKGYGTEAINLFLDYAFNHLNLNNIMLKLLDTNERAKKCYSKCGFKELGVRKQSHYLEGIYHDSIYMQILKEDFKREI